jgi:S1-C subfamily serine protease
MMVSRMMKTVLPAFVALGVLAAPAEAAQVRGSGAGQQCASCDSAAARNATTMRMRETEIANKTVDLARTQMLVEHIRSRLASGSPNAPGTPQEREELESMLDVGRRRMGQIERELSSLCGDAHAGHGYLGVSLTYPAPRSYPVVSRVEPASPAARAGMAAGDTIFSVNKVDVRAPRDVGPLIGQPGNKVTIGLTRGGSRREAVLTVAPRPATYGGACIQFRDLIFTMPSGQTVVMRSQGARGGSGGAEAGTVRGRASGATPGAQGSGAREPVRIAVTPDSLPQTTAFYLFPSGAGATALFLSRGATNAIVAGAEVTLINPGLKTYFAVDGALVVNVLPRSPAAQAGILAGDVIIRAEDETVTAISVLQRQIQAAGERRNVKLDIVRAKQPMVITLRW